MTIFLISAGVMILIAYALILSPILRKSHKSESQSLEDETNLSIARERLIGLKSDLEAGVINQKQFDNARSELEQNLAQSIATDKLELNNKTTSPLVAIFLTLFIPLMATGIYLETGTPSALIHETQQNTNEQAGLADIDTMVTSLAERLVKTPEDGEGWMMLGRSYLVMNRFDDAQIAFSRAYKILGNNVSLLVDYADAIGRGNNGDLTGDAKPLINIAIDIEPGNPKANWLAGVLAFQEQEYDKVEAHMTPLLNQTEPGSEIHESLKTLIEKARSKAGITDQTQQPDDVAIKQPVSLKINVRLSEKLESQVDPKATVYVFAKAVNGPPMPLAVKKVTVNDLPVTVTLDDSMAMRPDLKISGHDRVNISARISKSGNAMAQSGDLEGNINELETAAPEIAELEINRIIP